MKNLFFQEDYLTLILTFQCNFDCNFCFVEKKEGAIDFKTASRAIDFLFSLKGNSKKIKFFGGEPLLEFTLLKELVLYSELKAKKLKKEVDFYITSNGYFLNDEVLDFFKKHKIELTLSSYNFDKINKKDIGKIVKFPRICLNLDVFPEKVGDFYSEFLSFYKLGFRKFNILPAYYVSWPKRSLDDLTDGLEKAKEEFVKNRDISFSNSGFMGEVPLFNSCYTLDPSGNIYGSNIVLFKQAKKIKDLIFLGKISEKTKINEADFSLKEVIEKVFDKKTLESTFAADRILGDFIESITGGDNLNKKQTINEGYKSFKKADIKVGYSCNNNCLFCVQGGKRSLYPDKTTEEIKKILKEARETCQGVVFTGGEPTVRPDFLELAAYAKSLGFKKIQAQSNGRMFAYEKFCKDAVTAGVNEFALALHGHIPELHNYLTNSESFYQTVAGIKNLKKLDQMVILNTVVTKSNYRHLPEIAKLLVSLGVNQFQFAFVHALGTAQDNFLSVVPKMSMVMPYVKRGLDIGEKAGIKAMTEGIPYCLMAGYEDFVAEKTIPSTNIFEFGTKVDFDKLRPSLAKMKGKNCEKCNCFASCEGPWREYPERFGWDEFKPIAG